MDVFNIRDQVYTTSAVDAKDAAPVMKVFSKEGLPVGIGVSIRYQLDPQRLTDVENNLPRPVESELMLAAVVAGKPAVSGSPASEFRNGAASGFARSSSQPRPSTSSRQTRAAVSSPSGFPKPATPSVLSRDGSSSPSDRTPYRGRGGGGALAAVIRDNITVTALVAPLGRS